MIFVLVNHLLEKYISTREIVLPGAISKEILPVYTQRYAASKKIKENSKCLGRHIGYWCFRSKYIFTVNVIREINYSLHKRRVNACLLYNIRLF